MVTIVTRTLPATDTKPLRIIAKFGDSGWGPKSSTITFDHGSSFNGNHFRAAQKLWAEWSGDLDATYLGAGDVCRRNERVHLLKAFRGEPSKFTGERGGCLSFSPSADLS